jgi:ABC-2 type transport system permease protein
MRRIRAITRKEWLHVLRDPRSLAAALGLPVTMLLLYGFAVNFDLNDLAWGLVDNDQTYTSRELRYQLSAIPPFRFVGQLARAEEADYWFQRGWARVVFVIPPGFERHLLDGRPSPIQILVDGSEGTTANIALTYANGAISQASGQLLLDEAQRQGFARQNLDPLVDVRTRVYYNPDLESKMFLVPGLIAIILMVLAALLTSGVVVRARERGTFELLAASPITAQELLVGKILPYLTLGGLDVMLSVLVGWGIFGVAPKGSLLLLFGLSFVYVLTASSIGLFFSCVSGSQQTAMMGAFVATVIPSMVLSGFSFPVRNIPAVLQIFSWLMPATHYIVIARSIILKGVGVGPIWENVLALVLLTLFWMRLAAAKFHKTL